MNRVADIVLAIVIAGALLFGAWEAVKTIAEML